jgi:hypothetical protein
MRTAGVRLDAVGEALIGDVEERHERACATDLDRRRPIAIR